MALDSMVQSTKQGRLIDIAKQVDLSTVQHAAEIQRDRYKDIKANGENAILSGQWFWTADFPLYKMDKGDAVLYFADGRHNLAFQHLDDAVEQLRKKNNYFPNDSDIGSVINAKSTLRVKLSDLKLQEHNSEWMYFEIDTAKYSKLNKTQIAFAEKVHGTGKAFGETMKMLNDKGITTTRIYTLNPEYVRGTLKDNNVKSLALVSTLYDFGDDSYFLAGVRDGGDLSIRRLRGVLLGAEGAT